MQHSSASSHRRNFESAIVSKLTTWRRARSLGCRMSASPPTRVIFKKAWPFLANDIVADVVQTAIQAFNSRENQKQETYAQHRRERIEAIADQTNDSGGLVRSRGRGTSRIV